MFSMAAITRLCLSFTSSKGWPALLRAGYSWPALLAVSFPVDSSRMASQTETNMPEVLPLTIWLLIRVSSEEGVSPGVMPTFRRDLVIAMKRAAGIPFPETSAMARTRWSSSSR